MVLQKLRKLHKKHRLVTVDVTPLRDSSQDAVIEIVAVRQT